MPTSKKALPVLVTNKSQEVVPGVNMDDIIPTIDFNAIKNAALGEDYDLSLVICDSKEMAQLNQDYRAKNEPTDILSFPLEENVGEIYICPLYTAKMAPDFDRKYANFFAFLFIHGCAHLKGHDHSDTMEEFEEKLRSRFGV